MRRSVHLLIPAFLVSFVVWAGCGGGSNGTTSTTSTTTTGAGGATTSTSSTTTTSAGPQSVSVGTGGMGDTCIQDNGPDGGLDGICEPFGGEDCTCKECQGTALCVPDQCITDGVCDALYDSCICSDCDTFHFCSNPQKANCHTDGMCDSFHEGCTCPDCWAKAECQDNIVVCNGGNHDGLCEDDETCSCIDCFGTPKCVPCKVDGVCNTYDPCSCVDCINGDYCTDPAHCHDDGVCDILLEGCICQDCMFIPECTNPMGSGGGGAGGAAGAGGAGGAP